MAGDAVGPLRGSMRYGVCALAALALLFLRPNLNVFVTPQVSGRQLPAPQASSSAISSNLQRTGSGALGSDGSSSLCSIFATAVAVGACLRGLRVIMHGATSGSANVGQHFMPNLKGAKKKHVLRPRKNYGTFSALRQPRRYELYDILEELDESTPWYTIVSEPDEPMMPVEGVPLKERYPWAGELKRVHPKKERYENDEEDRMAPAFLPMWKAPPPTGRRQRYIERRGFATAKQPPWLNRFEVGYEVRVPHDEEFKKHRMPSYERMGPKLKKQYLAEQEAKQIAAPAEDMGEDGDDLDAELDAMGGEL